MFSITPSWKRSALPDAAFQTLARRPSSITILRLLILQKGGQEKPRLRSQPCQSNSQKSRNLVTCLTICLRIQLGDRGCVGINRGAPTTAIIQTRAVYCRFRGCQQRCHPRFRRVHRGQVRSRLIHNPRSSELVTLERDQQPRESFEPKHDFVDRSPGALRFALGRVAEGEQGYRPPAVCQPQHPRHPVTASRTPSPREASWREWSGRRKSFFRQRSNPPHRPVLRSC